MRGQRHALAVICPRERPGTHCIGGCVGPRAGLDRCGKSRLVCNSGWYTNGNVWYKNDVINVTVSQIFVVSLAVTWVKSSVCVTSRLHRAKRILCSCQLFRFILHFFHDINSFWRDIFSYAFIRAIQSDVAWQSQIHLKRSVSGHTCINTLRTGLLNCLNARSRGLNFRHRASCS